MGTLLMFFFNLLNILDSGKLNVFVFFVILSIYVSSLMLEYLILWLIVIKHILSHLQESALYNINKIDFFIILEKARKETISARNIE